MKTQRQVPARKRLKISTSLLILRLFFALVVSAILVLALFAANALSH
ncbi:hypothetical protein [Dictyobacter arantiisoli]|nr:hypothetical protein [Dictyobacter arantiisoli]